MRAGEHEDKPDGCHAIGGSPGRYAVPPVLLVDGGGDGVSVIAAGGGGDIVVKTC